ncbi:hypothetical protein AC579_5688 [Pseudocercospora musae]|uniref:Uncharacterized protein n=1 Tax=Pseudocercospora musae TaxID=113226 RepID=A0A139IRS8_9PEZI|nr:hypothetical protein AC579_5688 [Pseudocercospora musae]
MNVVWILALHYVIGSTDLTVGAATTSSFGHDVGFYIVDGLRAGERHGLTKLMLSSNATIIWNQTKDDQARYPFDSNACAYAEAKPRVCAAIRMSAMVTIALQLPPDSYHRIQHSGGDCYTAGVLSDLPAQIHKESSPEVASTSPSHHLPQTITSQTYTAPVLPRVIFTLPPTRFRDREGSVGFKPGEEITVHAGDRASADAIVIINDQITVVEGVQAPSVGQKKYSSGDSGLVFYDHDSILTRLASDSLHGMFSAE